MLSYLKHTFKCSQLLSDSALEKLCIGGKVYEHDQRGIKVIRLQSGDFLKIFRARNLFSATRVYSHARRFCRNVSRLKALGIPTVEIKALYHLQQRGHTAVLYQPLEGESIRNIVQHDKKRMLKTKTTFGVFLANLHIKGVHFHSLHTGNILLLPNNQFGLIDVSDMTIYPWKLSCGTRLRSFKRLCKYQEDISVLGREYWQTMLSAYIEISHSGTACRKRLLSFKPYEHY